jgi:uncharacterized protein YccT (UPF0319 family)
MVDIVIMYVSEHQPSLPLLKAPNDQISCKDSKSDECHSNVVVNFETQQASIVNISPTIRDINTNNDIDLTDDNFIDLTNDNVIDLTSDDDYMQINDNNDFGSY